MKTSSLSFLILSFIMMLKILTTAENRTNDIQSKNTRSVPPIINSNGYFLSVYTQVPHICAFMCVTHISFMVRMSRVSSFSFLYIEIVAKHGEVSRWKCMTFRLFEKWNLQGQKTLIEYFSTRINQAIQV